MSTPKTPLPDLLQAQVVEDGNLCTTRIHVPGGWIYRSYDKSSSILGCVFVPDMEITESREAQPEKPKFDIEKWYRGEPQWPQMGDTFYRLNSQGMIIIANWTDSLKQNAIRSFMGIFKTEAEAKALREKLIRNNAN
jgi:hypothetical protein